MELLVIIYFAHFRVFNKYCQTFQFQIFIINIITYYELKISLNEWKNYL